MAGAGLQNSSTNQIPCCSAFSTLQCDNDNYRAHTRRARQTDDCELSRAGAAGTAGTVLAVPLFSRLGTALVDCS